jgi:hypothetical protein
MHRRLGWCSYFLTGPLAQPAAVYIGVDVPKLPATRLDKSTCAAFLRGHGSGLFVPVILGICGRRWLLPFHSPFNIQRIIYHHRTIFTVPSDQYWSL